MMRGVIIGILCAAAGYGQNACVSAAAGNADQSSTWVGCGGNTPGIGDTVILNHPVTATADWTFGRSLSAFAVTAVDTSADTITAAGSSYAPNTPVHLYTIGGTITGGLTAGIQYYVCSPSGATFSLQTSPACAGSNINLTSAGSNVHVLENSPDLLINNVGQLIVATSGVEVLVRGSIKYAPPSAATNVIDVSAGGTLAFDPSAATNRTTTSYALMPTANSSSNSLLSFMGAQGNPATLRTHRPNGDEANGFIASGGFLSVNRMDANWAHFVDLGSNTTRAINAGTPGRFRVLNSTFTRTGIISTGDTVIAAIAIAHIENCVFEDSFATTNFLINASSGSTGTRIARNNYFDKGMSSGLLVEFTIENNVIAERPLMTSGFWTTWRNNFIHMAGDSGFAAAGNINDTFIYNSAGAGNAKELNFPGSNRTVDGVIVQVGANSGSGDVFAAVSNGGPGVTNTIRNTIIVPASDVPNKSSGTLVATGTTANPPNLLLENNIMFGGSSNSNATGAGDCADHGPFLSEGGNARADTITSYRGNIIWDISGRTRPALHGCTQNATLNDNQLSPSNAEFNTCFNCGLTTLFPGKSNQGTKYWIPMTGGTPGNGDVDEDPKFVDSTRGLEAWAAARGISPATHAGVLSALKTGDRTRMIPDLINWVRQGFAPRNLNLAKTAAPNGRIGAVRPILMFGPINGGN